MNASSHKVEEKTLSPVRVAGMRVKGRYTDCGKIFGKLCRKVGRHMGGKPMMLCYDDEYREEDADFEPCIPVKRPIEIEGVQVHELPGGRCLSLIHQGPYESLSSSYGQMRDYLQNNGIQTQVPSREIYLKGPGMIFKGNPRKYITELQFLIADPS